MALNGLKMTQKHDKKLSFREKNQTGGGGGSEGSLVKDHTFPPFFWTIAQRSKKWSSSIWQASQAHFCSQNICIRDGRPAPPRRFFSLPRPVPQKKGCPIIPFHNIYQNIMMNCTVIYTMKNNITPVFFLNHLFQGYLTFIRGKSTLSKNLYCWTNTSPALLTPRPLMWAM